jgi:hypothetical protein
MVNTPDSITSLVPTFLIWKVKVANTPEESREMLPDVNASESPPSIFPLVLFHKTGEFPMKYAEAPLWSDKKGPS